MSAAMVEISERLQRRIDADFEPGTSTEVSKVLTSLGPEVLGGQDPERVLTAIVLASQGSWPRFTSMVEPVQADWRDVLVAGGLANED